MRESSHVRILLAGDTHGSEKQAKYLQRVANDLACELIIVVGDFGYLWCGTNKAHMWRIGKPEFHKDVWFLPGNHEDYPQLEAVGAGNEVAERVKYLGRVSRFEVDGVNFLTVGGGVSVDRGRRAQGIDWFPQETISEADIHAACEGGPVDVILSHDAPPTTTLEDMLDRFTGVHPKLVGDSLQNRLAVDTIIRETQPRALYHGHYHLRYTAVHDTGTLVQGLNCNGTGTESWTMIDTERLANSSQE